MTCTWSRPPYGGHIWIKFEPTFRVFEAVYGNTPDENEKWHGSHVSN